MWLNQLFDISLHFRIIQFWKMESSWTFFSALWKRWLSSMFRTLWLLSPGIVFSMYNMYIVYNLSSTQKQFSFVIWWGEENIIRLKKKQSFLMQTSDCCCCDWHHHNLLTFTLNYFRYMDLLAFQTQVIVQRQNQIWPRFVEGGPSLWKLRNEETRN